VICQTGHSRSSFGRSSQNVLGNSETISPTNDQNLRLSSLETVLPATTGGSFLTGVIDANGY
jgi:hypothetical protein